MADEADRANDQMEEILKRSIAYTIMKKQMIKATGVCLNCGEPLDQERRFCNHACMIDWSKLNERR